jgi:CheY-like chemotaxis protein
VRLETVLAGGLWRVHADANQLENAILNLAVNARDAMEDGLHEPRLAIETANCHLDEGDAADLIGLQPGPYVMIAVTDTGRGMAPEVVARAFDPFFTTKEVGRGTGLGLSQVYGFVKQSGGQVRIRSEPGRGTTVTLYLPRLVAEAAPVGAGAATPPVPLPRGGGHEVVLVVEDEALVRQLAVEALRELGYGVLEADGAEAALATLDRHDVALLFTDIVMPGVNGRRLADEACRRRPALKLMYTTGYARQAVPHGGVLEPGTRLLRKPYSLDDLAAQVREALDA